MSFSNIGYYTHHGVNEDASGCTGNVIDPINVVISGQIGDVGNASNLVDRQVTWDDEPLPPPSTQTLKSSEVQPDCNAQYSQQKTGIFEGHHIRLWLGGYDARGRLNAVGDAHREHVSGDSHCKATIFGGDATYGQYGQYRSGFDAGAGEVYAALHLRFLGTRQTPSHRGFKQCNQQHVGWNGRQLFFALNGPIPDDPND